MRVLVTAVVLLSILASLSHAQSDSALYTLSQQCIFTMQQLQASANATSQACNAAKYSTDRYVDINKNLIVFAMGAYSVFSTLIWYSLYRKQKGGQ